MQADALRVIRLSGTALNRGRIHGEELRAEIHALNEAWVDAIGRAYGVPGETYLNAFLNYQAFEPAIIKRCPQLLDEMKGIAEGASLPFERILLLQLSDEEWVFGRMLWPKNAAAQFRSKCTAFGLHDAEQRKTYAGQNMDIPPFHEGRQVILHILHEDSDLEAFIFASAGGLGFMGLNNAPLGVCCNTLMELSACNDGLPVAFVLRTLLERTSQDEAEAVLRSIRHASGQNYLIATREGVGTFECSASDIAKVVNRGEKHWICHTNHALGGIERANLIPSHKLSNSRARLASIVNRVVSISEHPTVEGFKAALSASDDPVNPVSRKLSAASVHDSISYTAGSAIYEMGTRARLHIAPGPPCETAFRTLDFDRQHENRISKGDANGAGRGI